MLWQAVDVAAAVVAARSTIDLKFDIISNWDIMWSFNFMCNVNNTVGTVYPVGSKAVPTGADNLENDRSGSVTDDFSGIMKRIFRVPLQMIFQVWVPSFERVL